MKEKDMADNAVANEITAAVLELQEQLGMDPKRLLVFAETLRDEALKMMGVAAPASPSEAEVRLLDACRRVTRALQVNVAQMVTDEGMRDYEGAMRIFPDALPAAVHLDLVLLTSFNGVGRVRSHAEEVENKAHAEEMVAALKARGLISAS